METRTENQRLLAVKSKLFRVALTLLQDDDEAKDAVQDTYLKLLSMNTASMKLQNPEAFAMKMLKNLCIDRLRLKKKRPMMDVSTQFDLTDNLTPFQSVSFDNLKELMMRLFDTLPEQQRMVIHLRDIEHYSYEEIQDVTGLTINNIRVMLSRARQSVRSNYQKIKRYEQRGN